MTIFHSLNTSASALTAQRMRMDVIASNMANIDTTRGKMVDGEWQPYRRKISIISTEGRTIFIDVKCCDGKTNKRIGGIWREGFKH